MNRALAFASAAILVLGVGAAVSLFDAHPAQAADPDLTLEYTIPVDGQDAEVGFGGTLTGVTIDWGDGSSDTVVPDSANAPDTYYTHTYTTAGTYTVTVSGTTLSHFGNCQSSTYARTLTKILSWGTMNTTSLECAGYLRGGLIQVPTSIPSTVTNLGLVFKEAYNLNQGLTGWDTSNVTNMRFAFYGAHAFTGDVTSWSTGNVTDMSWMFADALNFNRSLSAWNTAKVTDMSNMFYNARAFDQNLGGWDISQVTNMRWMLDSSGLTSENYSQTLVGWSSLNVQPSVELGAANLAVTGCAGIAARTALTSAPNNWTINDLVPSDCEAITVEYTTTANNELAEVGFGGKLTGVQLNWGDDATQILIPDNPDKAEQFYAHTFATPGTYTLTISGIELEHFGYCETPTRQTNLKKVTSWGTMSTTSLECAGYGRTRLTDVPASIPATVTSIAGIFDGATTFNGDITAWNVANVLVTTNAFHNAEAFNQDISAWNVSAVQSMAGMFSGALAFNQNIGNWNTSNVASMFAMFLNAAVFNQDIGSWNTASLTNAGSMFAGATAFNQDISSWDTADVTDFSYMFSGATAFNQPIGSWNTGSARTLEGTFANADAFNQNLSMWNTSNVASIASVFYGANSFNGSLGFWNTSNVLNMSNAFEGASAFNQSLGAWKIRDVTAMYRMFNDSAMNDSNYSSTLIGWAPQFAQPGVLLGATSAKAVGCAAIGARQVLLDSPNNWEINDIAPTETCGAPIVAEFLISEPNETAELGFGGALSDISINWGEFISIVPNATDAPDTFHSYSYSEPGAYKAIISGTELEHFGYCGAPQVTYNLMAIHSWGGLNTTSLECGLSNRTSVHTVPSTLPSSVTNIDYMFHEAHGFDQNISNWNTENVTSMHGTFRRAHNYNNAGQPLTWDTSNVTTMVNMFSLAEAFNANVSSWNTGQVTTMAGMFSAANSFNQSLASWDVSSVTDMRSIFEPPALLTQFPDPASLNSAETLTLQNEQPYFSLSDANYSATLVGWASQTLQPNLVLDAPMNQAVGCAAVAARTLLTSAPNNWMINDIAPTDFVPAGGCPVTPTNPTLAQTGTSPTSALPIALGLVTLGAFAMFVISIMRRRER